MTTKVLPSWNVVTKHDVFADANHDEVARLNFLTHLNAHLSATILSGVKQAYETQVKPQFIKDQGHEPENRHQLKAAMVNNHSYQMWSALSRNNMEMRQQAGRTQVLRQIEALVEKVEQYNEGADTLILDDSITIPENIGSVDIHCQPGCYFTEYFDNDVTVAASYDLGLFVTTAGSLGALSDSCGQAIAKWLNDNHLEFKPKRILDIGCTVGHNVLPLAQAFPDAEVIAVDVARPTLRYAHARAKSLGVNNITFVQANAENLNQYQDESFDLITTAMFWHETSDIVMPNILKEINRLLKIGGLTLHLEQPQYHGMGVYEQFICDWDTFNSNEPYWGPMHDLDLKAMLSSCGFNGEDMFETGIESLVDENIFAKRDKGDTAECYGRAPVWNAFGLWKS